jgi:pyruvate kinase
VFPYLPPSLLPAYITESEGQVARPVPVLSSALESAAYGAVQTATALRHDAQLAAIVVVGGPEHSSSSALAKLVSKHRPHVPIFCMVPNHKEGRLLQVFKGVHPILLQQQQQQDAGAALKRLRDLGLVQASDRALVLQQAAGGAISSQMLSL